MSLMLNLIAQKNYISVNKTLIKTFGLTEAVILGELASEHDYWEEQEKLDDENMFFCTVTKLEENTGLNEYEQRKAIKHLVELGVVQTKVKGLPATRYFYLDENKLFNILSSSSLKFKELDAENLKPSNNIINKNKINNNTLSKDKVEENSLIPKNSKSTEFLGSIKKPKKENLFSKCVSLINEFTNDEILREMLTEFLKRCLENSKESGMPFYTNNFKGKLNSLTMLTDDAEKQRKIVKRTLDNGWICFYEIAEKNSKKKSINHLEGEHKDTDYEELEEDIERWKADGVKFVF